MFDNVTFRDIRNLHRSLPGAQSMGINDFSSLLNTATGTNIAKAGTGNRFQLGVKEFSAGVDDFLDEHAAPAQDWLGERGAELFGLFGQDEEMGRQVGRDTLRGTLDFAPAFAGLLAAPFTGGASAIPAIVGFGGLAGASALGAANAYEKSDSANQAIFAGAIPFAGGPVSRVGARLGHAAMRGTVAKTSLGRALGVRGGDVLPINGNNVRMAQSFADRVVGGASGEIAINQAAILGSGVANYADTGEWTNPFTVAAQLENLIDPTFWFGAAEVLSPTHISTTRIEKGVDQSKWKAANVEKGIKFQEATDPSITGKTVGEIERQYEAYLAAIRQVDDPEVQSELRAKLVESKEIAFENIKSFKPEDIPTLFGGDFYTKLEDLKNEPVTELVEVNGEVVEQPIVFRDETVDPEGPTRPVAVDPNAPTVPVPPTRTEYLTEKLETSEEPKTLEEATGQVLEANAIRDDIGAELVLDGELQRRFNEQIEEAASVEEAAEKVVQAVKTETVKIAKEKKKDKRTDVQKEIDEQMDSRMLARTLKGGPETQLWEAWKKGYAKIPKRSINTQYKAKAEFLKALRLIRNANTEAEKGKAFRAMESALESFVTKEGRQEAAAEAGGLGGRPRKEIGEGENDAQVMADLDVALKDTSPLMKKAREIYLPKSQVAGKTRAPIYMAEALLKWKRLWDAGELNVAKGGPRAETEAEALEVLGRHLGKLEKLIKLWQRKGWTTVKKESGSELNKKYDTKQEAGRQVLTLMNKYPEMKFEAFPWERGMWEKRGKEQWAVRWAPLRAADRELGVGDAGLEELGAMAVDVGELNYALDTIVAVPMDMKSVDVQQAVVVHKETTLRKMDEVIEKLPQAPGKLKDGPGSYRTTDADGDVWVITKNEALDGPDKWIGYKENDRDTVFDPMGTLKEVLEAIGEEAPENVVETTPEVIVDSDIIWRGGDAYKIVDGQMVKQPLPEQVRRDDQKLEEARDKYERAYPEDIEAAEDAAEDFINRAVLGVEDTELDLPADRESLSPDGEIEARIVGDQIEVLGDLSPMEKKWKVEHELGHFLWKDQTYREDFNTLWESLDEGVREAIDKDVRELYFTDVGLEERQVRALEHIRRHTKDKPLWQRFIARVKAMWKQMTGQDHTDPEALAAQMVAVARRELFVKRKMLPRYVENFNHLLESAPEGDEDVRYSASSRLKQINAEEEPSKAKFLQVMGAYVDAYDKHSQEQGEPESVLNEVANSYLDAGALEDLVEADTGNVRQDQHVTQGRLELLDQASEYLRQNDTYLPTEKALILNMLTKYQFTYKEAGFDIDGVTPTKEVKMAAKLKPNNQHMGSQFNGEIAARARDYMRLGQHPKEAYLNGLHDFVIAQREARAEAADRADGKGHWVRFEHGGDADELLRAVAGCEGGWCIGSSHKYAEDYLSTGSFDIYFDEKGAARVAIHTILDDVNEISGSLKGQHLADGEGAIAMAKVQEKGYTNAEPVARDLERRNKFEMWARGMGELDHSLIEYATPPRPLSGSMAPPPPGVNLDIDLPEAPKPGFKFNTTREHRRYSNAPLFEVTPEQQARLDAYAEKLTFEEKLEIEGFAGQTAATSDDPVVLGKLLDYAEATNHPGVPTFVAYNPNLTEHLALRIFNLEKDAYNVNLATSEHTPLSIQRKLLALGDVDLNQRLAKNLTDFSLLKQLYDNTRDIITLNNLTFTTNKPKGDAFISYVYKDLVTNKKEGLGGSKKNHFVESMLKEYKLPKELVKAYVTRDWIDGPHPATYLANAKQAKHHKQVFDLIINEEHLGGGALHRLLRHGNLDESRLQKAFELNNPELDDELSVRPVVMPPDSDASPLTVELANKLVDRWVVKPHDESRIDILQALSHKPLSPESVAKLLAVGAEFVDSELVFRKDLTSEQTNVLFDRASTGLIRERLIGNSSDPTFLSKAYESDPTLSILHALAQNKATPEHILVRLAEHEDPRVGNRAADTVIQLDGGDSYWGGQPAGLESAPVSSVKDIVEGILTRKGMSAEAVDTMHEPISKLFDVLGVDPTTVDIHEILNSKVRGVSVTQQGIKRILLNTDFDNMSQREALDALSLVTGHEIAHLVQNLHANSQLSDRQTQQFQQFEDWTNNATAEDHLLAYEIVSEMLPKRFRTNELMSEIRQTAGNAREVQANLLSMWASSQTQKPDSFVLNLLPHSVRQGLRVLSDISRSIYGAMKGGASIVSGFKSRTEMRARVDEMVRMASEWKGEHGRSVEFRSEVLKVGGVGRAGRKEVVDWWGGSADKPKSNIVVDERGVGRRAFDAVVMNFDGLAEMVPTLRGINHVLHNFNSGVKASIKRTTGAITGSLDEAGNPIFATKEGRLEFEKVRDKPQLNKLFSDWLRVQNDHRWKTDDGRQRTGKKFEYNELVKVAPDLYSKLHALNPKDRQAVIKTVHRFGEGMQMFQLQEVMRAMDAGNIAIIKALIASKDPKLWEMAPGLAESVYKALRNIQTQRDPGLVAEGTQTISQLATILDLETFQRVMETARKQQETTSGLLQQFQDNPHFASEMRFGKYFLHWRGTDGKTGGLAFETIKEMQAYEQKLLDDGVNPTEIRPENLKRGVPHLVGEDRFMEVLKDYDERNRLFVETLGLNEEMTQQLNSILDYGNLFNKELKASKMIEQGSRRGFKHGREELDMVQTQFAYFNAATRAVHKKILNNELQYQLTNPELKEAKVQAHMPMVMEHIENFLSPDTTLGTNIAMGNAAYFLGLNFSSHMVEFAQPAFSFLPELLNKGVGFVEANRMLAAAQGHVAAFTMKHIPSQAKRGAEQKLGWKILQGKDDNTKWTNPEYQDLMNYAGQQGWISLGHAADIVDLDVSSSNIDLSQLAARNGAAKSSFAEKGLTPIKHLARSSLKLYQQFTEYNARVALIAGYELARKQGKSRTEAIEEAGVFARNVTFSGGKATRPTKMFSGKEHFRTAGQAAYSLNGYTFGMLSMMRRYAETAFNKTQYPGLTEADRKRARKALLTMTSAQFLGAGLLGMPFIQAAMEMLEKTTGIEIEREVREGLADLFEEDEKEDGGLFSDIVMHGAANAILGRAVPGGPDVGSRFSIGGVLGVNAYDGFSLGSLIGPTGSVVENVAKGTTSLLKDRQPEKAFEEFMPVAWKKGINLWRNDGELRDQSGGLLVDATFGEKFAYGVGFTPQRVKKMKNYDRLYRKHQEREREKEIATFDQITDVYMVDPRAAMMMLQQQAEKDQKVQMFAERGMEQAKEKARVEALRTGAAKVAERVEKRTFARDPRREGTFKGTAGSDALINAMGQGGKVSEAERLMVKSQVMQTLGFEGSDRRAFGRAQMVDEMMRKNPNMPRPTAVALVERQLLRNPALRRALSHAGPGLP